MWGRIEEEVEPMVVIPRHRPFVVFFNTSVKAPMRAALFTVIPKNRPISVAVYDAHGDTENLFSSLNLQDPTRTGVLQLHNAMS